MEHKFIWPEVFEKGVFDYEDKRAAIADAYQGWGLCCAKAEIPEKFGDGMAHIGTIIGVSPIEKNLAKLVKELKKKGEL